MYRLKTLFSSLSLIFLLVTPFLVLAEESITITTYYPSPYGSYNELYVASKLGIGTTSPNARLDLGGGYGASGEKFFIYNDNTSSALAGTKVGFYMDRFSLSNNSTFVFPTAGANPGSFIVASKDTGGTTLVARMTVLGESGNVGIGTTSPGSKLDVSGGNGIAAKISVGQMTQAEGSTQVNAGTYNLGRSYFYSSWDDNLQISTFDDTPNPNWTIGIGNGAGGWSGTKYMTMNASGNVGIGTAPASGVKLDVAGRISSTMARAQWSTYGDWSTTSTAWVDTDAVVTVTTTGGPLLLFWTTQACNNTAGAWTAFRFTIDGAAVTSAPAGNSIHQTEPGTTTYQNELSMTWLATGVAAGSHTIRVQIKVNTGTGYIGEASGSEGTERTLIVIEL